MPPNKPFKHSRWRSLWPLQWRTVTSPSNCGFDLPCKLKTPSTCYVVCKPTRQNWHTKYSTDHTIGTRIPLCRWDAMQSYMKTATHTDYGCPGAWIHSTWVRQKIIADATIIMFPRRVLTVCMAPPNCSHNIANCLS